jgi:hypothetical protein
LDSIQHAFWPRWKLSIETDVEQQNRGVFGGPRSFLLIIFSVSARLGWVVPLFLILSKDRFDFFLVSVLFGKGGSDGLGVLIERPTYPVPV